MPITQSKTPTKATTRTQDSTEKVPARMQAATIKRSTTVVSTSKHSSRGDSSQNPSSIKIKTQFLSSLVNLKSKLSKASQTRLNLRPEYPINKNHTATYYNKKLYFFGGYDGKKNYSAL